MLWSTPEHEEHPLCFLADAVWAQMPGGGSRHTWKKYIGSLFSVFYYSPLGWNRVVEPEIFLKGSSRMAVNSFCIWSMYWKHQISLLNICEERVLKRVFILAMDKDLWILGQGCYGSLLCMWLNIRFVLLSAFCFLDLNDISGKITKMWILDYLVVWFTDKRWRIFNYFFLSWVWGFLCILKKHLKSFNSLATEAFLLCLLYYF